jgi:hypothetical protein
MKFTYTIIAFLFFSITQAQQPDLESMNRRDLITLVGNKDKEIGKLNQQVSSLKTENLKSLEKVELVKSEKEEIERLLKETTNHWLKQVFIDKYIKNDKYFLDSNIPEIDVDREALKRNFEQYDIILKSVLASNPSKDHELVANRALEFNKNYLALFRIKSEVLTQRYSEALVEKTLKEIDSLPVLKVGKLQETKIEIIGLLKNYKRRNCELKQELDNFSKVPDQEASKPKYKEFEKDVRFKDYPYLIKILQDIQKNVNLYTKDSLPCEVEIDEKVVTEKEDEPISKEPDDKPVIKDKIENTNGSNKAVPTPSEKEKETKKKDDESIDEK